MSVEASDGGVTGSGWKRGRVLVVDDDPISRNIIRELLILDIFLPGLDGRTLHASVKTIDPSLARRTVFMSHWEPAGAIGATLTLNGPFLKKPFGADDLLRTIEQVPPGSVGSVPV